MGVVTRPASNPGRAPAHDAAETLQRVLEVFWERGFEAATYDALEQATGLRRQSLVYAFGDKHSMFLRALDLYAARRVEEVCALLEQEPDPRAGLAAAVQAWRADALRATRRGCLLVNTAGERGSADPQAAARVEAARARLVQAFADALRRAGFARPGVDAEAMAALAVAAGDGALLHARNAGAAEAALAALNALDRLLNP
jgi:TetR/AcrR family transcriptional repressor of nem operon